MHSDTPLPDNSFPVRSPEVRDFFARLTFGFALLIFLHRWLTHTLVFQMHAPQVFSTGFDYTYWFYQASGFPRYFVDLPAGAFLFDTLLLLSTLYCFFTAGRKWPAVLCCAGCWTLYALTYNHYSNHHNHTMFGIMVLPYAFLARGKKTFSLVWDGFRYLTLYVYTDAFVHKVLIAHNFFYFPNGVEFIKTNQAIYMLANPDSTLTKFYTFFITHPSIAYAGFVIMVLLQGSMIGGFFTKKWDKYLFFVPFIFHTLTWLFMDVFFYELLILNITLLPFQQLQHKSPDNPPVPAAGQ